MILQKLLKEIDNTEAAQRLYDKVLQGEPNITVAGLAGSAKAMVLAYLSQKTQRPLLVVTPENDEAEVLYDDLKAFLGEGPVFQYPDWGISPYEVRSPHTEVIGQRLLTLYNLHSRRIADTGYPLVIVGSVKAVAEPTIPEKLLVENSIHLKKGSKIDYDGLIELLAKLNYKRSPVTEMLGEYSVRGGIIDVFTPYDEDPVRIEFFGDEIDSIRHFSVLTQRSTQNIDSTYILPRREFLCDYSDVEIFAEYLDETKAQALHVALGANSDYDGLEFLWPGMNLEATNLFAHLPPDTIIVSDNRRECDSKLEELIGAAEERFGSNEDIPFAPPDKIYLSTEVFRENIKLSKGSIDISAYTESEQTAERIHFRTRPQEFLSNNIAYMKNRLSELYQLGYELNILCESAGQKQRIGEIIEDIGFPVGLHVARLTYGFSIDDLRKWYLVDHQIFTRHKKRRTFKRFKEGVAISSYTSLNPGDYVVHIDYGIGKYKGLETLVVDGRKRDCLAVFYLGDDKLYVPVEEFNRVQKYAGKDGAPRLSKLGSGTWERVKARTKRALMDMASELVELYAERKAFSGFAFKPDSDWMRQLEASFEYQETPDQLKVMDEIKTDMQQPIPMDRLVCGDVGYGKTELAIRAALKAIDSGKQVAVLAPTTILAAQHFSTFSERLEDFPIKIEMMSRFRTSTQTKLIKQGLADGTIDIVIGTHKLLQKDVEYKNLGLLVIDEEQRFGVAQKEKIKKIKSQVDVLTLTATPIPRTLQLSLAEARDMSIINTPPKERLPITTEVARFSDKVIVDAVNRELDRGGQVFFVHNRVQSIWAFYRYLKNLLPLVKIGVGHGQMSERELEKVMKDFLERKYDILLSTTIIESGLDIPSVNTIIINRADRLGLAQLYQLRGRVGRSHFRAYAYLLVPPLKLLTREARKRLKAIEEFTELGSGFHLAMRDLEIRGAGNLLGAQQHGFIEEVGFDLYIKLLEEAVAQLKGKSPEEHFADIKITTDLDLFLPENYISDSNHRVDIYRRFSDAAKLEDIEDLMQELNDRFGQPPEAAINLANLAHIRILCRDLKLKSLQLKGSKLILEFADNTKLERSQIEDWVANIREKLEFKYGRNFIIQIVLQNEDDKVQEARNILQKMHN